MTLTQAAIVGIRSISARWIVSVVMLPWFTMPVLTISAAIAHLEITLRVCEAPVAELSGVEGW
jgi:hypothetical protein